MAERDEQIQASLDEGGFDKIAIGEDKSAYRRLYAGLAAHVTELGTDFSSRVMLRIINERLKRAKRESILASLVLSGLALLGVVVLFSGLSYLNWFQFDKTIFETLASMPVYYLWPCLLASAILLGMDQVFSRWVKT